MKKLIVLALVLGMVSIASAGVVYEQLNAGVFDGTRADTLPNDLNIGMEGSIYIEFKDPLFNAGHLYFAMSSGDTDEIAIVFRNVAETTISPYVYVEYIRDRWWGRK